MTQTALKLEDYMEDGQGRLVPKEQIQKIDILRDELVKKLVKNASDLQKAMLKFKKDTTDEINAFVELSALEYDVKLGGKKGNLTLFTYDASKKVQVQVAENLVFDERLQVAKKMIDECLANWTEDSRPEVKTIINDAFRVDKEGKINTKQILSLRRLSIKDKLWCKAMDAITDSLQVSSSKQYIRIYEQDKEGAWKPITLDMAALKE